MLSVILLVREAERAALFGLLLLTSSQHWSITQRSDFGSVFLHPNSIANANGILKFAKSSNINYISLKKNRQQRVLSLKDFFLITFVQIYVTSGQK